VVQNMAQTANDGTFIVVAISPGMFSVVNALGVTESGSPGTATALTPQSPIFVTAGP
jgi:hypothetical protein